MGRHLAQPAASAAAVIVGHVRGAPDTIVQAPGGTATSCCLPNVEGRPEGQDQALPVATSAPLRHAMTSCGTWPRFSPSDSTGQDDEALAPLAQRLDILR